MSPRLSDHDTATRTPNVYLLKLTLVHVFTHPRQWDQRSWSSVGECGTAHCYGGWACVLHGATFPRGDHGHLYTAYVVPPKGEPTNGLEIVRLGKATAAVGVGDYAQHILGLDDEQADELFYPRNSLDDLRLLVGEICSGVAG